MRRLATLFRRYILPDLCPACRRRMEEKVLNLEDIRRKDRELRPKLALLQAAAPGLCRELLALPEDQRRLKIKRSRYRMRSRPLAEELLKRSRRCLQTDPRQALHLADLALEIALTLFAPEVEELSGGSRGIADLQALALGYRANAYRVACDLDKAQKEFARVDQHLQSLSGDPLVLAELLWLKASYFQTLRDFPRALEHLGRAAELYQACGEEHLRGSLLVTKGAILRDQGELPRAVEATLDACVFLDAAIDPQLEASALHNLALFYCELGRFTDAAAVLEENEEYFFEAVEPGSILRLNWRWTLAKVSQGLGQPQLAEALLEDVKKGFEAAQSSFNVALVLLDQAELFTEMGRLEDVASLAEETYTALAAHRLHREAARALHVFTVAARRQEATRTIIRTVAEALVRHRHCKAQPS